MVRSMTGFGRSLCSKEGLDISVEIKSVNSRYLDCSTRISRAYSFLEERIKPFLQEMGVSRGKVEVSVTVENNAAAPVEVVLDEGYAKGYLNALYQLRDTFGLKDDISVTSVARNQDLFLIKKAKTDEEHDWELIKSVLSEALEAFLRSREKEGDKIAEDMNKKANKIASVVDRIEVLTEGSVSSYREKLAERIREALSDNQITPDENRLLTECAIYADKVAVDEELTRLRTHLAAFREMLSDGEPVGRRMDFLLQEMNREINTTGSKCNNAEIAQLVVDVKCELEKVREQIQNLE